MSQKVGLKRLGFVEAYTKASVDTAGGLYVSAKKNLLPAFLKVRVEKAEEVASDYTTPTYYKLAAASQDLLGFADTKVDQAVTSSSKLLNSTVQDLKSVAEPEVLRRHLNSAKNTVASKTTKAVDYVKAHGVVGASKQLLSDGLTTAKKVINYSLGQGKSVAASAQKRSEDAAHYAYGKGQAFFDVATKKSRAAHDAVVKQPMYKNAYERTNHIVAVAQDTKVYKAAINHIYPIVAPVYNPAYQKIEPYYKSTINYWKPVTAAA